MKKFNKRMGRSRSGVSDIIGNLLILAITVTLFSSIMFYVANMPEPAQATFTDLEPSLSNIQDDSTIWVNVTHKGGQTLKGWSTGIYIFVNGTLVPELGIDDGGIGEDWKTGEVWRYKVPFANEITGLSIMIVDKDTNSIVWQTDLLGGVTNIQLPPIIGTRYTSPSPGLENRSMVLYVQVMDPNDDNITGVYADMTALGLGIKTLQPLSKNLYSVEISDKAKYIWDNRIIIISATDETGRSSSTLMTIRVNPASGGSSGGGGGGDGEFPNFDTSGLQGFALFEWNDWNLNKMGATNRNIFFKDTENAVLVMISKTVVNTIGKNELLVMNPNTKVVVTEVSSTGTPPNNFKYYGFIAGFYIYNSTVDTSTLGGNYSISATLTDSKTRPDTFTFNTWMNVLTGTADSGYPTFKTYKGSFSLANEWTHFSVSDQARNKILVEIQTEDAYPYMASSGNVEIRDFVWATQVKGSPATTLAVNNSLNNWNGPVSNLWQVSAGNGIYRFVINLANCTSGAEWLPMNNAYILRFDVFKTTGETFLLTKVIYIDAPTTKYDIVTGVNVEGGPAWGAQATLFYYENDNRWTPPIIMEESNNRKDDIVMPLRLQGGDINGDGNGDFAALVAAGDVNGNSMKIDWVYPALYMGTGSSFFKITLPSLGGDNAVLHLDLGNVDQDDDLDLVVAYDKAVYLYRNDGAWSRTTIASGVSSIVGVRIADMDAPSATGNDPERSKDIVIVTTASIMVCQNKDGAGTFNPVDRISLQPDAGTTPVSDWALTEETPYGQVTLGTNLNNTRGEANQYNYEELWEKNTIASVTTYPKITGAGHTAGETLSDMWYNNDSLLFTILPSRVMNITNWDHTGLSGPQGEIEVNMVVNYSASGYDVGESIPLQYFNETTGLWVNLTSFDNGAGYLEIPLDFITTATDLINLNVRYVNSATGTLNLDVMSIRVDYPSGDRLEHIWAFTLTAGTGYKFNLFTAINASADGDAFKFQYSKDMFTWTDIVTVSNSEPLASITPVNLAAGLGGQLHVRVISTGLGSSTPSNDWIKVGQMYISCTATLSKIGKSIQSFDIGDLDGDGSNDIAVCTISQTKNRGEVWALYNRDYYASPGVLSSGIFDPDNIKQIIGPLEAIQSGVNNIEIGRFFGNWNDTYLDLVIRVGNSMYYVNQYSKGNFTALTSLTFLNGMTVTKMMAEDVDGNGRCDLVFGTGGGDIILWANYGGTTTYGPWAGYTWQRYLIDNLGVWVYDISGAGVAV